MDKTAGFGPLDWAILIAYFVGITAFGLWLARRVKSSGSYFLGDRKLPWWIMIGQAFGTGTHAEHPVSQTGASYNAGFATLWYQWKNMLITPVYWLIAPWYRRSERTTIAEIVEDRYGRAMGFVYAIFAIAFFVFSQGAMLKGAGKVIAMATAASDGTPIISANGVVLAMIVAFVLYSFFGGLIAAAYTDFIQGFLIIVLSFLLIPAGLSRVGGLSGMRAALPADFFELYNEASGLGAFMIAMLAVNGLVGIVAQPHILAMCGTGKTERAGRVGQTYGSLVKRVCTLGWAFTGLIVAAMVIQQGAVLEDKEQAFGWAALHLLGPGLIGLLVACVLAANMSTCSNFMINMGALFTRNLYVPYCRPSAPDRELLRVGRISGVALTGLAILFAVYVDQVLQAFLFTETISALMGVMFLGGFLWKRANRWGAAAATLASFGVYYFANYHEVGKWMLVYKWTPEPFAWAMVAGFGSLIVVSLLTPPESKEKIDAFFDKMRRSTDHEGLPDGAPKPLAADEGKELLLLDLPGWFTAERRRGFWRRYREDLIGLAHSTATVAGLIGLAWVIIHVGG